jgi:hypothetical protein
VGGSPGRSPSPGHFLFLEFSGQASEFLGGPDSRVRKELLKRAPRLPSSDVVIHVGSTPLALVDDDTDRGLFMSRGSSSPFGKLTEEVHLRLSFSTLAGLQEKATTHGMSVTEYVRTMVDCEVHGVEKVASIAANRVRQVAGKGG